MNRKVRIVADSTCDLSPELLQKYRIDVIPLPVNLGDRPCLDGVDVHTADLFAYYQETGKLPTTSAPTPAYYEELYAKWAEEGWDVVHLSISLDLTSTHRMAKMAAEKFDCIYPVDSRNISSGMGLLALRAAELRDEGQSAPEIAEHIASLAPKVRTSFVLSTLLYMYKGGRCTGVQALGANLLNLKPCIELQNGSMGVTKKYRGNLPTVAARLVEDKLKGAKNIDCSRILITHCQAENALDKVQEAIRACQPFEEICVTDAGCSVSVHCGPGTLGIIYLEK